MPAVKCSVDGCNTKLQPLLKVDPRDRSTWTYPECDLCFRPVCEKHSSEINGQVVCDTCCKESEAQQTQPQVIGLGLDPLKRRL